MKPKLIHQLILPVVLLINVLSAGEDHKGYFTSEFKTAQEVTQACLECHEDAAKGVMQTVHWTWDMVPAHQSSFADSLRLGKKNVINNYCIAVESNWPRCTSCHVGYGWQDESFDFSDEKNVDCLVCHDQTGLYKKSPAGAGMPAEGVDLLAVAQNVGPSTRENCGVCHFYGGGGENVKHGDLDEELVDPTPEYDVHMGNGMTCQDCHTTENHNIKGRSMAIITDESNRVLCTDCHESNVHDNEKLNTHSEKIACQTCHIPVYAKAKPTKIYWDWSTSGSDKKAPKDKFGLATYSKEKGDFVWDVKIKPEYYWYNGNSERYLKGDKLNPEEVLFLNRPSGSHKDENSKIYPFKVMRGKQIYDTKNNYLIIPKLWGGYWKYFDWNKASEEGMKVAGLDYSGEYGWIDTEMYWKLNHMVSPKEDALKCTDCHGKSGERRMDWEKFGYKGDQMLKKYRK